MSERRLELQKYLETILGSKDVYFQPPNGMVMSYPAIVYEINKINNKHANDLVYKQDRSYSLTVIDSNPDSKITDKISKLPMCNFDRHFTSDRLNHFVFTLYY